jgi:predicted  nucleic acid-binding Zn-ribbon protein
MKLIMLLGFAICSCTYNTTDQAALAALQSRLSAVEQRQDTLESRVTAQGEAIQRLNQHPYPYHK